MPTIPFSEPRWHSCNRRLRSLYRVVGQLAALLPDEAFLTDKQQAVLNRASLALDLHHGSAPKTSAMVRGGGKGSQGGAKGPGPGRKVSLNDQVEVWEEEDEKDWKPVTRRKKRAPWNASAETEDIIPGPKGA